jgi:cell division protein ZipA
LPELRWILLALGIVFFLGLWWWEARRGRQAADSSASLNPADGFTSTSLKRDDSFTSTSTTVVRDSSERPDEPGSIARELPPWDVPDDDEAVEDQLEAEPEFQEPLDEAQFEVPPAEQFAPQPVSDIAAAPRPPRERIEPIIGDAAAAVGDTGDAPRQQVPERIVTLRVAAPPLERFEGRRLVEALRTAGLEYGKFSIFHKSAPDGTTLFSVASLVEPGTFDLDAIEGRRFPGVSIFVVLRAGADSATFDDMIGTARSLAGSLQGTVQDERGAPMSPQKLADLRADVLAWQRAASSS